MKHKTLPAAAPHVWLARLGTAQQRVSMLAGDGKGWGKLLAWNPTAQFVYRRGHGRLPELSEFVEAQTAAGRKVLGYLAYDLGYELLDIPQTTTNDLNLPDAYFLAYDNYLELTAKATIVHYRDEAFLHEAEALSQTEPQLAAGAILTQAFKAILSKKEYDQAYAKVKQYILDGDTYQVNLTHRLEAQTRAAPRQIFARLSERTTAGFMAYLEGPDFTVHSVSPERFVQINGKRIETYPIKGTRPRGPGSRQELLDSPKDAAELNMITDLLRNDLGRVSQGGSVKVLAAREILQTPTLFHTFSHIVGTLRDDVRPIEAVLSMFPGGSITGCPKKRAMEIIDELEPYNRSVYCGSVLAIEPDGSLDSSIPIRTLIQKGNRLVLQVGGGIVHHSQGNAEYQETWDKAKAIITALAD